MSGMKTSTQIEEEKNKEPQKEESEDIERNKISIPATFFDGFNDITYVNKDEFEYIVYQVITQFLEKFKDKALEFPGCVGSNGRSAIHDLASSLGLAHHSQG